jgi:two-component system, OmpR family, response regulator
MLQSEYMAIYPLDIYAVTDKGRQELNRGSTTLPPNELELLLQLDSRATVEEIVARSRNIDEYEAAMLIPKLMREGLVQKASIAEQEDLDFRYFFDAEKTLPTAVMQAEALREAEPGTLALQRDGYYVSITRKSAQARKLARDRIAVLVIEDDPQISYLLALVIKQEGFEVRTAANRAQVVSALRQLPSPNLVLLDVNLPDANGFDILERMKQHPVLKSIPVIMLTGEATRENVIRGLAEGADGYITKPFEVPILRSGIKNVLGLD